MSDVQFKAVKVSRGRDGWGGPLVILPTRERDKIVAVTGGGIPPIARRIAELTGGTVVDGFRAPPPESEMACVIVDCGGTARCGVYPRKRIPTVNLTPVGQSGPLAEFITEDIYVSGVTLELDRPGGRFGAGDAGWFRGLQCRHHPRPAGPRAPPLPSPRAARAASSI